MSLIVTTGNEVAGREIRQYDATEVLAYGTAVRLS